MAPVRQAKSGPARWDVQPAADAGPVSALTLDTSGADGAPMAVRKLMFRGARIERFKSAVLPAAARSR